jgi:hypothetical protein
MTPTAFGTFRATSRVPQVSLSSGTLRNGSRMRGISDPTLRRGPHTFPKFFRSPASTRETQVRKEISTYA